MRIVLASKSPRRKELLKQIGLEYECIVSNKEEKVTSDIPKDVVLELSNQKAEDVYQIIKEAAFNDDVVIIGADTVVALKSDIMGKPKDNDDAVKMLKKLNGNVHSVWTGVTIICKKGMEVDRKSFAEETRVFMNEMSEEEIEAYVKSGEPSDKAGAYAIQGIGAKFIQKIEGDYNNVVGLPVSKLYQVMKEMLLIKRGFYEK